MATKIPSQHACSYDDEKEHNKAEGPYQNFPPRDPCRVVTNTINDALTCIRAPTSIFLQMATKIIPLSLEIY